MNMISNGTLLTEHGQRILICGSNGQLGLTLQDVFAGNDLVLTDRDNLDITDEAAVNNFVDVKEPEIIINAAAYTAVDLAEEEKELARQINVIGAKNLALSAKKIGAVFFHISTDFVFDGEKNKPYIETDEPNPLSVYGKTKLESEKEIEKIGGKYFILRTSWLYSPYGKNFVKTFVNLGREKDELKVVNDQIGCPTYTYDLAMAIKQLSVVSNQFSDSFNGQPTTDNRPLFGLYHYCGENECSWFDFATEIVKQSGGKAKVLPITSYEFAASKETVTAKRPAYSPLNCDKIRKLGIKTFDWHESLIKCLEILKEDSKL